MALTLRLLDPLTDQSLYRIAYSWRTKHKPHVQPDRMPFEVFVSDDPRHITIGLFEDEMVGLYFLHELDEAGVYQVHATSKRGVSRETLLVGAREVARLFLQNGATALVAFVTCRNHPLCRFVEAIGFTVSESSCQSVSESSTLPSQAKAYVKYVLEGIP